MWTTIEPVSTIASFILRFLVERWHEDLVDGKSPDDHCCFTVAEIREHLRDDRGRASTDGTVRKRLTRIRQAIPERHKPHARRTLGPDAVVEHVEAFGYSPAAAGSQRSDQLRMFGPPL